MSRHNSTEITAFDDLPVVVEDLADVIVERYVATDDDGNRVGRVGATIAGRRIGLLVDPALVPDRGACRAAIWRHLENLATAVEDERQYQALRRAALAEIGLA